MMQSCLLRLAAMLVLMGGATSLTSGQGVPDPNTTLAVHSLTVARHPSLTFTNADADARFAEGTAVLQDGCTADDQRCCALLERSGGVVTFPASLSGPQFNNLTTSADLTALMNSNVAHIKVVTSIMNGCGVQGPGVLGCAAAPGSTIVLVGGAVDGRVWAHEFGHNKGLLHNATHVENVMYPSYSGTPGTNCRLTLAECQAFHTTPTSTLPLGCATACPGGGGEPNDFCASATGLATGAAVNGYICPQGDADWYSFTLAQASNVTITMSPPSTPCLDYDIQLHGACGTYLSFSAASGCTTEVITANGLAAGTYRVYVVGYQNASSSTVPYTLSTTATPVSACGPDPSEANDSCAAAATITPNAGALSRYICPQGDVDWYGFTLSQVSNVTVTMTPPSTPCLNYEIQLFGACGSYMAFSAAPGCAVETITANNLAAGSYRIYVVGSQSAWSSTAPYTIAVTSVAAPSCGSDPSEPNESCTTAATITPNGGPLSRYICPQGDVDWYAFTLSQTSSVTVSMTPPSSPCLNYEIQLFGACGSYMAFSAGPGCATETITVNNLAAGSYRVYVVGSQSAWSSIAPYSIAVTSVSAPSCGSDPSEPNDACTASATIIPNAGASSRYLCPQGDTDWYSFTLSQASLVTITMSPPQSPCLDYDIQLFGGCGSYMTYSASGGCLPESIALANLAAGTYQIFVVGYQGAWSALSPYTIAVTSTSPSSCVAEPGVSTNGTCAGAPALTSLTCINGTLSSASDEDWYQVTYSASQVPRVIALLPPASPCSDYDVELYGACGAFLAASANPGCLSEGIPVTSAGTYRIRVRWYTGATTSYTLVP